MSWNNLSDDEKKVIRARATHRGMNFDTPSHDTDLVVDGHGIHLTPGSTQFKSKVVKPTSLDELIAAAGPSEHERKQATTSRQRLNQRDHILRLAHGRKLEGAERARVASVALKAAVRGVITAKDLKGLGLSTLVDVLVGQINIWQWLFPTITVTSGTTLTFSGSATDVHSLVAYKLIIEPNARVVVNKVPVNIDCTHLEVQ